MKDSTVLHWVLGVFFLTGLACLIGSCFAALKRRRFLQTALTASGIVVENIRKLRPSSDMNVPFYYSPRIRFQATDGHEIDFVSGGGRYPPKYTVNETVAVLYDPQDPNHAEINSLVVLWGGAIGMAILGVAFTAFAIMFFVLANGW